MCIKPFQFILKNGQTISIIGSVLLACAAWVYSVNGLPHRMDATELKVSQLEKDVSELKSGMAEQNAKLSLALNAIYEIRGVLLKGK